MDRLLIIVGVFVAGVATLVSVLTFSPSTHGSSSPKPMMAPLDPLPPIELRDPESASGHPSTRPESPLPGRLTFPQGADDPIQLVTGGTSRLGWAFSSSGGWRAGTHDGHDGDDAHAIDWNLGNGNDDVGEMVTSVASGRVIYARASQGRVSNPNAFGYGNTVIVQLANDLTFAVRYAHLRNVMVSEGEFVALGDPIGTVGATGLSGQLPYTAHLHLVLYQRLYEQPDPSDRCYSGKAAQRGIDWLRSGQTPCQLNHASTKFAARFRLDPGIH